MAIDDKLRKLYIDLPSWSDHIEVDDFLVAVGKKQSNSVYHVAKVKSTVPRKEGRVNRFYMMVYKTDLITALQRDEDQQLIIVKWYSRNKKQGA
jgi:hypothetical protein